MRSVLPWLAVIVGGVVMGSFLADAPPGQLLVGGIFLVMVLWLFVLISTRRRDMDEKYGPAEDDPERSPESRGF